MPAVECQKILGVNKRTLTKWEQGRYKPNREMLKKIVRFLGHDPALAIDWPVAAQDVVLSDKDLKLGRLADFASPFRYEGN